MRELGTTLLELSGKLKAFFRAGSAPERLSFGVIVTIVTIVTDCYQCYRVTIVPNVTIVTGV